MRSASAARVSFVLLIRFVIIDFSAVPASAPRMPRVLSSASAVFVCSRLHPNAAAVGPMFSIAWASPPTLAMLASAAPTNELTIRPVSSALIPNVAIAVAVNIEEAFKSSSDADAWSIAERSAPVRFVPSCKY